MWSTVLSLAALFGVGAARTRVGTGSWWSNGFEMLGLGVLVGAVAYGSGVLSQASFNSQGFPSWTKQHQTDAS